MRAALPGGKEGRGGGGCETKSGGEKGAGLASHASLNFCSTPSKFLQRIQWYDRTTTDYVLEYFSALISLPH